MKTNFRCVLVTGIMVVFISLLPLITKAQTFGFNTGDPDAPLDGGVSLLIAAGVGYGIKRAKGQTKKRKDDVKGRTENCYVL